jgi:transmembrane sensor
MQPSPSPDTIRKIATGDYTPQELTAFLDQLDGLDETAYIWVYNELYTLVAGQSPGRIDPAFRARLEARLNDQTGVDAAPVIPLYTGTTKRPIRWIAAAAILILLLAGAAWWFETRHAGNTPAVARKQDLPPGGNKAVLTLSNGQKIILDSAKDGSLAIQNNTVVNKRHSGELEYEARQGRSPSPEIYNTLTTPRGGQYLLTLPDGSRIWLNAASSVRYPTAFNGKRRSVDITGEAYLEIARDPHSPFIVHAGGQSVEVLGTGFNVNAYSDETATATTLIEGSVRVDGGNTRVIVKPGEQASTTEGGAGIRVARADPEAVLAWKNGQFEFSHTDIASILRQIARWYDVTIIYKGNAPKIAIYGEAPRNLNLSEIVKVLALSGVHCEIDGKDLIVSD